MLGITYFFHNLANLVTTIHRYKLGRVGVDNPYGIFYVVDVLQHKGGCVTGIAQRQGKTSNFGFSVQYD